jgi:hypothetical protein
MVTVTHFVDCVRQACLHRSCIRWCRAHLCFTATTAERVKVGVEFLNCVGSLPSQPKTGLPPLALQLLQVVARTSVLCCHQGRVNLRLVCITCFALPSCGVACALRAGRHAGVAAASTGPMNSCAPSVHCFRLLLKQVGLLSGHITSELSTTH